ncbi:hypothetical protein PTKIN_Ptkin03bG0086300 [Pterospermum kingtungense]
MRAARIDESMELLKEMKEKECQADVVTLNVLLGGLCREDEMKKATKLLGLTLDKKVDMDRVTDLDAWLMAVWNLEGMNKKEKLRLLGSIAVVFWEIWKERYVVVFQKKGCEPNLVIWKINRLSSEIEKMNKDSSLWINGDERSSLDVCKGWEKSDCGWLKVNCVGEFSVSIGGRANRVAGIGVIVSTEEAQLATSVGKTVTTGSALEVEAMALHEGMVLAERDGFRKRNANKVADWVATNVKRGMCISNSVNMPPSSLVRILSRDGLPTSPLED